MYKPWKNSYYRDVISPEFILIGGWRRVRKDGKIKIAKAWFQHEKLLQYIGTDVYCDCSGHALDGEYTISVFKEKYHYETFIVNAELIQG